jgi:hypothetical protein
MKNASHNSFYFLFFPIDPFHKGEREREREREREIHLKKKGRVV